MSIRKIVQVRAELYKLASLSLCSNTVGQLATGLMINPPKEGEPSYKMFQKVGFHSSHSLVRSLHAAAALFDWCGALGEVHSAGESSQEVVTYKKAIA